MSTLEGVVDAAAQFITPLLDKGHYPNNEGVEEILVKPHQSVEQALGHLQAIHDADRVKDTHEPYDGSLVGVVYGLIDLVALQGILPSLSPGVVISQRARSVLVPSLSAPTGRDIPLLTQAITALLPLYEQHGTGIQPLIAQRMLPDLISGVAELAFSPEAGGPTQARFQAHYEKLLKDCPTSRLLPILTSFVQQDAPPWFQQRLSKELALVPLRSNGIRHTVDFVCSSYLSQTSSGVQEQPGSLSNVPIPLEAVRQISRLLASVPSGMEPYAWFSQLAPQLWSLLDGDDGVELSRVAGQVIASGILSRKTTGSPGSPGWELFAAPVLRTISPETKGSSSNGGGSSVGRTNTLDTVLVSDADLLLALKRLSVIVSSHSHPGLIKRLVHPVLLPLWGLMEHARPGTTSGNRKVTVLESQWIELPQGILSRYMALAMDPKQIEKIVDNIFWDGQPHWTFGPGSQGGIEIRQRENVSNLGLDYGRLIMQMETLEGRVNSLIDLLSGSEVEDDAISAILLGITLRWLSMATTKAPSKNSLRSDEDTDEDPLVTMAYAKVAQAMATKFQDKFARKPRYIMELVTKLLQDFVHKRKSISDAKSGTSKPSRFDLGNIVNKSSASSRRGKEKKTFAEDSESEVLVSFALSVLNITITSPDFTKTPETDELVSQILPSLRYLAKQYHQNVNLPPTVVQASQNLISLLQPTSTPISEDLHEPVESAESTARASITAATSELTSPEPASRAWALSTLGSLIRDPKTLPFIDVPSTTHMILRTTMVDTESFVYIGAISFLARFASVFPSPVLRILVDAYNDTDEQSLETVKDKDPGQALDFRLRLGEVLAKFVTESEFWTEGESDMPRRYHAIELLTETTLLVAGRRGQRLKTLGRRHDIATKEMLEQQEAEAAWDGPIPNLFEDTEDENASQRKEREFMTNVVEGWQSTGPEEDVRIRSSAMSILGSILEKRLEFVTQNTVNTVLQMVTMTLLLERAPEKALVRRAAALVIMGLLRALYGSLDEGKHHVITFSVRQSAEIERTLKWVQEEDSDDLVKGHVGAVLEGLETLRMKQVMSLNQNAATQDLKLNLEGGLRGLEISPEASGEKKKQKAPLIEEVE